MNVVNMIVLVSLRPKLAKRKVTNSNQWFFYPHMGGGGSEMTSHTQRYWIGRARVPTKIFLNIIPTALVQQLPCLALRYTLLRGDIVRSCIYFMDNV